MAIVLHESSILLAKQKPWYLAAIAVCLLRGKLIPNECKRSTNDKLIISVNR